MAWFDPAWSFRKTITVDPSKVGTGGVVDFPLYVDWSADAHVIANSQSSGNDILFTSEDGTTQLPHELERSSVISGNASGINFAPGSALRNGNYTYYGSITSGGSIKIAQYNHSTGEATSFEVAHAVEGDDHNVPALLRLAGSGKIVMFWSKHAAAYAQYAVQNTVDDITAWTTYDIASINTVGAFGWTYMKPFQLDNGNVYLFWRGGDYLPAYSSNSEAGVLAGTGWPAGQALLKNEVAASQRPYPNFWTDGVKFGIGSGSTNPEDGQPSSFYYLEWDGATTFKKADGTTVASALPCEIRDGDKLWDYTVDGNAYYGAPMHALQGDVAFNESGYPVLTWNVTSMVNIANNWAWYAVWTGSTWTRNEIAQIGSGTSYSGIGGVAMINHTNLNEIAYTHYPGSASSTKIRTAITTDSGATWTHTDVTELGDYFAVRWVNGEAGINHRLVITKGVGAGWVTYFGSQEVLSNTPFVAPLSAWVRVGSLSDSVPTIIYMYYGNAASVDQGSPTAMWTGWGLVYHMTQRGLGNASDNAEINIVDSTYIRKLENPSSGVGHIGPFPTSAGKLRHAQVYSVGHSDYRANALNLASQTAVTLSAWVKGTGGLIISSLPATTEASAFVRVNAAALAGGVTVADGTIKQVTAFTFSPPVTFDASTWHYTVMTYDGTTLRAYVDGSAATNPLIISQAFHSAATALWGVGSGPSTAADWVGTIDEARAYIGTRSLAEVVTDYNNQNSPSTFYALSGPESLGSAGAIKLSISIRIGL